MTAVPSSFSLNAVPEIHFGPGRALALAGDVKAVSPGGTKILLVADAALLDLGLAAPIQAGLEESGASVVVYGDIAGEPKARQIDAAAEVLRRLEPHSPVPYLVKRAVKLGRMPFPTLIKQLVREESVLTELYREFDISSAENAAADAYASTAKVPALVITGPIASPSSPSVRFTALDMPTITTAACNGTASMSCDASTTSIILDSSTINTSSSKGFSAL